jgi:hypothetical protein
MAKLGSLLIKGIQATGTTLVRDIKNLIIFYKRMQVRLKAITSVMMIIIAW